VHPFNFAPFDLSVTIGVFAFFKGGAECHGRPVSSHLWSMVFDPPRLSLSVTCPSFCTVWAIATSHVTGPSEFPTPCTLTGCTPDVTPLSSASEWHPCCLTRC
jgi:hypothetical protein